MQRTKLIKNLQTLFNSDQSEFPTLVWITYKKWRRRGYQLLQSIKLSLIPIGAWKRLWITAKKKELPQWDTVLYFVAGKMTIPLLLKWPRGNVILLNKSSNTVFSLPLPVARNVLRNVQTGVNWATRDVCIRKLLVVKKSGILNTFKGGSIQYLW